MPNPSPHKVQTSINNIMSKDKFKLSQWRSNAAVTPTQEVEMITSRIEQAGLDIAPSYGEWRDLGFALAQALGQDGRSFFHRLSRFYSGYKPQEADRQYSACLASHGHGITLNTFFHLARRSGVDICTATAAPHDAPRPATQRHNDTSPSAPATAERQQQPADPATFAPAVYASLPRLLADVTSYGISAEDTDMLLLGSLTALSSCLTQVSGVYGQRLVYPNLFLFVSAKASAGKGRLTLCRHLVDVVHADLRKRNRHEWEEYRLKKAQYDARKRKEDSEEPLPPPVRMLLIPANSSATALFQTLNDNEGRALMFETEGDTLTTTFKSEHGNYSDGFRKAFHHESITYNRRKDREYVEISAPRLSVLLSGTPRQVGALIPDAENGLFSRFLFYCLPLRPVWNDVFADCGDETLDYHFVKLGARFFAFYNRLMKGAPIRFTLTPGQQAEFNRFFSHLQEVELECLGSDMLASVRRMGLTAYRICMVLSTLRLMDYEGDVKLPQQLVCRDDDFHTVLSMMDTLPKHAGCIYQELHAAISPSQSALPASRDENKNRRIKALFEALPDEFTHADYARQADALNINARTADRYINELCTQGRLEKPQYGTYRKKD